MTGKAERKVTIKNAAWEGGKQVSLRWGGGDQMIGSNNLNKAEIVENCIEL